MSPAEYIRALVYPLRSAGVLAALATFLLLSLLASQAGILGIWLGLVTLVALVRYLMLIAEARAQDLDVAPPGAEYFSLIGNLWTLFPAVIILTAGFFAGELEDAGMPALASALVILVTLVFPAMIAVLTLTHSPLESINPVAITRFINRLGANYLYAVGTGIAAVFILELLGALPAWLAALIALYLAAAFFSVIGGLTHAVGLEEEVGIADAIEVEPDKQLANLDKQRTGVLNHAYGFASRGNRAGAMNHIESWLREDPDPDAGWPWFFDQMLRWEQTDHALFFAQRYIGRLLATGDRVSAVKVILRGRLVNERFRPAPEHMEAAIEAARATGNTELASALERL